MDITRSVPSPNHSACNTTLFYFSPIFLGYFNYLFLRNASATVCIPPPRVRVFFGVLLMYCSRVSELLGCCVGDIVPPDRVVVKGLKGSGSYVILLPGLSAIFDSYIVSDPKMPIFSVTYSVAYRWAKKIGLESDVGHRKNKAVTHSGRYCLARRVVDSHGEAVASDLLHHRGPASLHFYTLNGGFQHGKTAGRYTRPGQR